MTKRGRAIARHTLRVYDSRGIAASGRAQCDSRTRLAPLQRIFLAASLIAVSFLSAACTTSAARAKASYHYQMGLSYLGENNITGALVELTEAEKITPDDPDLLNKLALAYYFKKKYELAEQRYLRALKIKPEFSEARNNLGVNYLQMGRWDSAIQQFKLAIDDIFFRDQEQANINLALAYLGKGDHSSALAVIRGVVTANPRNVLGHLHFGRIYFAMDKPELAIDEYRKALDLNKNFAMAHYQLALAYLKIKERTLAKNSFKEVMRLVPDSEIGQLSREYLDTLK
ncbi:MAG TPA: tetratricopeptide repeat protein [Geobacteraceae bacterium]